MDIALVPSAEFTSPIEYSYIWMPDNGGSSLPKCNLSLHATRLSVDRSCLRARNLQILSCKGLLLGQSLLFSVHQARRQARTHLLS